METKNSYYEILIREFSNIEVNIKVINITYKEPSSKPSKKEPEYSIFEFYFQNKYKVRCHDYASYKPINHEYSDYLNNLRLEFYNEVNEDLNCEPDYFIASNRLTNQINRFKDLLLNYEDDCESSGGSLFKNNRLVKYSIDDTYSTISEYDLFEILNSFLLLQIKIIEQIIDFLKERTSYIANLYSNKLWDKRKIKPQIEPIKLLDRYQTALLFDYLKEVEAIRYPSEKRISTLVSELTGHSENTLRTEAFAYILQIKKGKTGNLDEIKNDKSYAIKKVKQVIEDILKKVNDDINNIFPPEK